MKCVFKSHAGAFSDHILTIFYPSIFSCHFCTIIDLYNYNVSIQEISYIFIKNLNLFEFIMFYNGSIPQKQHSNRFNVCETFSAKRCICVSCSQDQKGSTRWQILCIIKSVTKPILDMSRSSLQRCSVLVPPTHLSPHDAHVSASVRFLAFQLTARRLLNQQKLRLHW